MVLRNIIIIIVLSLDIRRAFRRMRLVLQTIFPSDSSLTPRRDVENRLFENENLMHYYTVKACEFGVGFQARDKVYTTVKITTSYT